MGKEFDRRASAQVGSADPDNNKNIGVLANFGGCFADARKFIFIELGRKIEPAEKVVPGAVLLVQHIVCLLHLRFKSLNLFVRNKRKNILCIQRNHGLLLSFTLNSYAKKTSPETIFPHSPIV